MIACAGTKKKQRKVLYLFCAFILLRSEDYLLNVSVCTTRNRDIMGWLCWYCQYTEKRFAPVLDVTTQIFR